MEAFLRRRHVDKEILVGTSLYESFFFFFQFWIWLLSLSFCIAYGTPLRVMWQLGWEGSVGENGFLYMYG